MYTFYPQYLFMFILFRLLYKVILNEPLHFNYVLYFIDIYLKVSGKISCTNCAILLIEVLLLLLLLLHMDDGRYMSIFIHLSPDHGTFELKNALQVLDDT